jgi:ferric-dicitrate binding protein FerR (iron transport regulator)
MDNSDNWSLIAKHLAGAATRDEEQALGMWLQRQPMPELDTQEGWQELIRKIESHERAKGALSKVRSLPLLTKIAAILVVLTGIYLPIRYLFPTKTDDPGIVENARVFSTADSVKMFYLPDSSTVWLNTHTSIRFPQKFDNRSVSLTGEATFNVRKAKHGSSFIVISHGTQAKVTGTTFNVAAREGQPVQVTVVEGQVVVTKTGDTTQHVTLNANDRATVGSDSIVSKSKADSHFLDWRKKNNAVYERETKQPKSFIKNTYTWRKNVLNETLIEGKLTNTSMIASYKKIRLKISSVTSRGKKSEITLDVASANYLQPGQSVTYRQTLFDVFSQQTQVTVVVQNVQFVN